MSNDYSNVRLIVRVEHADTDELIYVEERTRKSTQSSGDSKPGRIESQSWVIKQLCDVIETLEKSIDIQRRMLNKLATPPEEF